MPGKKPKERQRYMLRINDTFVEVTRAVYLAWYQAGRKERYQVEKMQRHGVCSMEELQEKGYDCSFSVVSPEEIVIRLSEIQELEKALGYLTKEDAELITLLFFEEFTVKETAQYFGCCPKTIRNRRKKVLEKLKENRQSEEYDNYCSLQSNIVFSLLLYEEWYQNQIANIKREDSKYLEEYTLKDTIKNYPLANKTPIEVFIWVAKLQKFISK